MSFDCAIILGGGLCPDGSLPVWSKRRFELALELCPEGPLLALSGGTVHKPNPLDAGGRPVFESHAGAAYLLSLGVAARRIHTEISSYDTIGNAYFARVEHTDVRGWRRLLVVTSEFHMPRSEAIFRWVFSMAPAGGYELTFAASANEGMAAEDLRFRVEREAASLRGLQGKVEGIGTLAGLHEWLYAEHGAYRAESVSAIRAVDPGIARVY